LSGHKSAIGLELIDMRQRAKNTYLCIYYARNELKYRMVLMPMLPYLPTKQLRENYSHQLFKGSKIV
jgi:hypothetical protein